MCLGLRIPADIKALLSHIPVRIGEDIVALLLPAIRGRRPDQPLLTRWFHNQTRSGPGSGEVEPRRSRGLEKPVGTLAIMGRDRRPGGASTRDCALRAAPFVHRQGSRRRAPGPSGGAASRYRHADD